MTVWTYRFDMPSDTNKVILAGHVHEMIDNKVETLGGARVINFTIKSRDDANRVVYVDCSKWDASGADLFQVNDKVEITGKIANQFRRNPGENLAGWQKIISVDEIKVLEKYVEPKAKALDAAIKLMEKMKND